MHITNFMMRHFLPTQVGERFYIINEGEVSVRKDGEELSKLKTHEYALYPPTLAHARKHMLLHPAPRSPTQCTNSRAHVHLHIYNIQHISTHDTRFSYFGERSLIKDEPRQASIYSVDATEMLVLDRATFQELLMPTAQGACMHSCVL